MKNKYLRHARISEPLFRALLRCFCQDVPALAAASLVGINRNSANRIYGLLRARIADMGSKQSSLKGEVEVDESYFGARRVPGKRGRGAHGKTIVFGILERDGVVHTEIVSNVTKATLQKAIRGRVAPATLIHSDGWPGYNGLVEVGFGHLRVDHGNDEFACGDNHINGIESFWSFAKRRLAKFNGLSRRTFHLHLKECEWRFNHRGQDLYRLLLAELRKTPL